MSANSTVSPNDSEYQLSDVAGGAIPAPLYNDDTSDPADWANQLQRVAPWGEFGSRFVSIASPRSSLATVADPKALAAYWNKVSGRHW